MTNILWIITGLLSALTILIVVLNVLIRKQGITDTIHMQANCHHPYTYRMSGKKLCARCGKEQPSAKELYHHE